MANYRLVSMRIWKDPDVEQLNPSGKLVFMYLITNEATTESGIYPITFKTIANETSLPSATVGKLLATLKNISYDTENNCIFIHNFLRYNGGGRPDLLKKALERECKQFRTPLWHLFVDHYPEYLEGLKPLLTTVGQQLIEIDLNRLGSNKDKKLKPLSTEYSQDFLRFWSAYPVKEKKQDAFGVWQKLKPDAALIEQIVTQVKQAKNSRRWLEGFAPHPTTYLNGRRWEDEISLNGNKARTATDRALSVIEEIRLEEANAEN
jgi:hypothetical protein